MLDRMSDSIQASRIENLHSREVDRQSPTGLIFHFGLGLGLGVKKLVLFTSLVCVGAVQWKLNLETLDNIMKTSQMSMQALWSNKSPILQLPHVTEDMLRHFVNKKVRHTALLSIIFTLCASSGALYCNQSCLFVCGWVVVCVSIIFIEEYMSPTRF